jgi:hypothetical protein
MGAVLLSRLSAGKAGLRRGFKRRAFQNADAREFSVDCKIGEPLGTLTPRLKVVRFPFSGRKRKSCLPVSQPRPRRV